MSTGSNKEAVIAAIGELIGADASCSVDAIAKRINLTELALKLGIPRRSLRRLFNTVEDAAIAVRLAALDDMNSELEIICKSKEPSPIKLRNVCACLARPEHAGFFSDHRDVAVAFERHAVFFISSAIFDGGFDEGLDWVEDGLGGATAFVLDVMRGLIGARSRSRHLPEDAWDDARNIDRFESHMRLIMRAFDQNARHVIFTEITELDRLEGGVQIRRRAAASHDRISETPQFTS